MAIRKHWKKLMLAVFASFWVGCDTAENPIPCYGSYVPCEEDGSCGCGENGEGCFAPDYGVMIPDSSAVETLSVSDEPAESIEK